MKIITPSTGAGWTAQVTCAACKAVLEVDQGDLRYQPSHDPDPRDTGGYWKVACGECDRDVTVKPPETVVALLQRQGRVTTSEQALAALRSQFSREATAAGYHQVGTRVVTTRANAHNAGWTITALAARRWGVAGVIEGHHNSHGLHYDVRHADGTLGAYEEEELNVVGEGAG